MAEIRTAGVDSIIVYFGDQPSERLIAEIGFYSHKLQQALGSRVLDLVPSYTSILIHYDLMKLGEAEIRQRVDRVLETRVPAELWSASRGGQQVELPVCYDLSVAPDLQMLSEQTGLTIDEIVRIHSHKTYRVFAIGFSPGFGYLGELDARLRVPRLATPRTEVPAGSVAIAEQSTAVYPQSTPGGWWLIGRCPVPMFDKRREPQSVIEVGDEVRFYPISLAEFNRLKQTGG